MKGKPSDAFRALAQREGIVVEFGQGAEDGAVALSDRITLPLETAKRLVLALNEPLARHAARIEAAEQAAARGQTPVNAPRDAAGEKAALLLELVGALGVPCQHERSFRLAPGRLDANRFLLSLNAADVPAGRALEICQRLSMPRELREAAADRLAMASCLHFGFEAGEGGVLCKFYLERAAPAEQGALLHLAYKWNVLSGASVVSEYRWYPASRPADIAARLAALYPQPSGGAELAQAVLELAAARAPAEKLQYLEVREPDNGRRSFDLNLYDAGLQLKDVQGLLVRMRERFGVRPGEFQALYDQIKARPFGHLAGGVHRDGREFFNVYYGVSGLPRFAELGR